MSKEIYLESGRLVSPGRWNSRISLLKQDAKEDLLGEQEAVRVLSRSITAAILERVPKNEKFGVMLSGGVDSSLIALIAKRSGRGFTCYTVGFKDDATKQPEDLDSALEAAKLIGVKIKSSVLDIKESAALIKKTAKILGPDLANVVNVGVGAVVLACVELAQKDGVKYLFSGLGSEEIFAGYERHRKAADVQLECWNGLFSMYERDLLRDSAIASATGMNFLTPLLDESLIVQAMAVPASLKLNAGHSKFILRKCAESLGLPKSIAWRKKRAAQYGSRIDSAIEKLARMHGFGFKKDYLASLF